MGYDERTTSELIDELMRSGDRAPLDLAQAIVGRGTEAVEALRALLRDEGYWDTEDQNECWVPVHAVKLLGAMGARESLPELLLALDLCAEYDDDWTAEDLPHALAAIGPVAIGPLMEHITSRAAPAEWHTRSLATEALAHIAQGVPEERPRILAFLHGLLDTGNVDDQDFLSWIVGDLLDLRDPSSRSVIEAAFARGLVDEVIVSLEDVIQSYAFEGTGTGLRGYDLLEFYLPQEVAARQRRWQQEREAEKKQREKRLSTASYTLDDYGTATRTLDIGRNDPCPCGSGIKHKKCCGRA
ncbi:MAG: SEC-C domain-containing protein [Chloroflexi bacterium]|nr:SEC-C domain-containing protein [Chloroflexota bacterium]